jgi:hypothetical protein
MPQALTLLADPGDEIFGGTGSGPDGLEDRRDAVGCEDQDGHSGHQDATVIELYCNKLNAACILEYDPYKRVHTSQV